MKNNKGFTLIELIAVVVILAVIMLIAVPNVVSTINKNKKEAFIEDAKKFKAAVEAKIASDTSIDKPNSDNAILFPLEKVGKAEISESPYGTKYSKSKSFVIVVKVPMTVNVGQGETITKSKLEYYVHLVACKSDDCKDADIDARYGLNLAVVDNLYTSDRFDLIVQADDVNIYDLDQDIQSTVGSALRNKLGSSKTIVKYTGK